MYQTVARNTIKKNVWNSNISLITNIANVDISWIFVCSNFNIIFFCINLTYYLIICFFLAIDEKINFDMNFVLLTIS